MEKSQKISILSSIVLVGFLLAVIFHLVLRFSLKLPSHLNIVIAYPASGFCDFKALLPFLKDFAPFKEPNAWINYFPLAYIVLFPFSLIKNKLIAYLIFASGFLIFLISMNVKSFICENSSNAKNLLNIFILTAISYPVITILYTGNFDMFLFILFACFVYSFKVEKYLLSASLLAVQNAIKPFFILFLLLFLFKKKYKEFFLSLISTGLLIIAGFMILNGNFFDQVVVFIKDLILFKLTYVYQNQNNYGTWGNSSLFMPLKLMLCQTTPPLISIFLLEKIYNYLSMLITALILFCVWKEKIFWKQILLLTINMLLIPYVIFDYKLIFLLIPIWLFVNVKVSSKYDIIYTILLGLLLIPKNGVILVANSNPYDAFSIPLIIINPLIMMALVGLIIYEQIKKNYD